MIKLTLKNTDLERRLREESEASGQDPETLAQEILSRGLSMQKFRRIREKMAPQAQKAGFADEDTILRAIS
ncbi:MAG: hypothetical protein HZA02_09310 [Nitrospinae bacterium]|nr:hypothetical protein [Nitrospinota bacterium]